MSEDKWAKFHEKALPYERAIKEEPFKTLIETILNFVSKYQMKSLFETGFGTGYVVCKLASELKIKIQGIETSNLLIQKAQLLSQKLNVPAHFYEGNIFKDETYLAFDSVSIIYHQGLLEHFSDTKIKELLELQTKNSFAVIFSVPSFFYSRQDFGDERLLTIEQWQEILIPFNLIKLEYYDDKKHILGILKGGFYDGRTKRA